MKFVVPDLHEWRNDFSVALNRELVNPQYE